MSPRKKGKAQSNAARAKATRGNRFSARGATLREAVELLGPFPTPKGLRCSPESWVLVLDTDYRPPHEFSDYTGARDECVKIGRRLQCDLKRTAASPRLSTLLRGKIRPIEDLSGRLSRMFAAMTPDEYRIVIGISRLEDGKTMKRLEYLRNQIGFEILIPKQWALLDEKPSQCELGEKFETVSQFFGALAGTLEGIDKGGSANVTRLISGSPEWKLVHDCWRLFESLPHLSPTTSKASHTGGLLDRYCSAILEWVTGEHRSVLPVIKQYARVRKQYFSVAIEFRQVLMEAGYRTLQDIQFCVDRRNTGKSVRIPKRVQPKYDVVASKFNVVNFHLSHGFPVQRVLAR
jgi:hypothetical protein